MTTIEAKEPAWSENEIGQLKTLFEAGLSSSQIAARLGTGKSRYAVIGKLHRLGISHLCVVAPAEPRERSRPPRPVRQAPSMPTISAVAAPLKLVAPVAAPPALKVAGDRITITTLETGMCKWPIGDPGDEDFHFCGNARHGDASYCAHHCSIAYNRTETNRRLRNATKVSTIMRLARG